MTDEKCIVKYKRFVEGMKERGFTVEDINKFKYCGGLPGQCHKPESHVPYFHNYFKYKRPPRIPPPDTKCVCKHPIMNCCLITKDDYNLIVCGNCCINHFIGGRTCDKCGNTHKNRKTNICNECRAKLKSLFSELKKKHRIIQKNKKIEEQQQIAEKRRMELWMEQFEKRRREEMHRESQRQFTMMMKRNDKIEQGYRLCLGCTHDLSKEPSWKKRCFKCYKKHKIEMA